MQIYFLAGNDALELCRRLLASVPHASQSYNISPYIDLNYFRYDERLMPMIDRPRQSADMPLRFHRRATSQRAFTVWRKKRRFLSVKAQIYTGNMGADEQEATGRPTTAIVYYVWHPTEPLCLSVQKNK